MLRNRIRSNSGATILLALLFFLLCSLAGSVILTAGSAASGRISGLQETEQSFYSVTSAAQVLKEEIEGQEFQAYTENDGAPNYTKVPDCKFKDFLIDAFKEIYEENKTVTGQVNLAIHPSSNDQEKVTKTVNAKFIMKNDYTIEITFSQEGSEKYLCKLTATPQVNRNITTSDITNENNEVVEVVTKTIQVHWNECRIDKG